MAINLDERYPGRANPKSLSYPQGSLKNRTSPTSKDGTYLEQDWANDIVGFLQYLLANAEIQANGVPDTAISSQYAQALQELVKQWVPITQSIGNSTTSVMSQKAVTDALDDLGEAAHLPISSTAQAQELTNNATVITPAKLAAAFGGVNQSATGNGYQRLPGGVIIQWGSMETNASGNATVTFPVAFSSLVPAVVLTPSSNESIFGIFNNRTLTKFEAKTFRPSGAEVATGINWIAIGK